MTWDLICRAWGIFWIRVGLLGCLMLIWAALDAHLGAFWGSLGSTSDVLGRLGGDFGVIFWTLIGNVGCLQMCGKQLFFVVFSWVGGCLEVPDGYCG